MALPRLQREFALRVGLQIALQFKVHFLAAYLVGGNSYRSCFVLLYPKPFLVISKARLQVHRSDFSFYRVLQNLVLALERVGCLYHDIRFARAIDPAVRRESKNPSKRLLRLERSEEYPVISRPQHYLVRPYVERVLAEFVRFPADLRLEALERDRLPSHCAVVRNLELYPFWRSRGACNPLALRNAQARGVINFIPQPNRNFYGHLENPLLPELARNYRELGVNAFPLCERERVLREECFERDFLLVIRLYHHAFVGSFQPVPDFRGVEQFPERSAQAHALYRQIVRRGVADRYFVLALVLVLCVERDPELRWRYCEEPVAHFELEHFRVVIRHLYLKVEGFPRFLPRQRQHRSAVLCCNRIIEHVLALVLYAHNRALDLNPVCLVRYQHIDVVLHP